MKYLMIIAGVLLSSFALAQATTVLFVPQGGTGRASFTSSQLLYGNGTNALSSAATTSVTCAGTASCTTFTAIGGAPITITGTGASGSIGTTSALSIGQGAYFTGVTPTVLGGFSTTTATCAGTLSCTGFNVLGSSPITLTGGAGGNVISTTSPITIGNLAYYTGSTPTSIGSVATTALSVSTGLTSSGTLGAQVGGTASAISFASIAAGSLWANGTAGTAVPTVIATSSLYGASATGGFTLTWNNGQPQWVATTTLANITGTLSVSKGGTGQTTFTSGQLLYGNLTNALSSVATSSPTFNGGLTTSGTAGAWVGGSSYTVSLANVNANSVLGCVGGAACTPTSIATSSLYTFPWTIANGGTATTTFYNGGILFYNSTLGTISQSAAATNFFWDETNKRQGLASSTPTNLLSLGTTGSTYGSIAVTENPLATSTAMTIDWTKGNQQLVQIAAAGVTIAFSNASTTGQQLKLIVCNSRSAAGTITWANAAVLRWAGGTAPSQTTTANKCDVWSFLVTQATSTSAASPQTIFGAQTANF